MESVSPSMESRLRGFLQQMNDIVHNPAMREMWPDVAQKAIGECRRSPELEAMLQQDPFWRQILNDPKASTDANAVEAALRAAASQPRSPTASWAPPAAPVPSIPSYGMVAASAPLAPGSARLHATSPAPVATATIVPVATVMQTATVVASPPSATPSSFRNIQAPVATQSLPVAGYATVLPEAPGQKERKLSGERITNVRAPSYKSMEHVATPNQQRLDAAAPSVDETAERTHILAELQHYDEMIAQLAPEVERLRAVRAEKRRGLMDRVAGLERAFLQSVPAG